MAHQMHAPMFRIRHHNLINWWHHYYSIPFPVSRILERVHYLVQTSTLSDHIVEHRIGPIITSLLKLNEPTPHQALYANCLWRHDVSSANTRGIIVWCVNPQATRQFLLHVPIFQMLSTASMTQANPLMISPKPYLVWGCKHAKWQVIVSHVVVVMVMKYKLVRNDRSILVCKQSRPLDVRSNRVVAMPLRISQVVTVLQQRGIILALVWTRLVSNIRLGNGRHGIGNRRWSNWQYTWPILGQDYI